MAEVPSFHFRMSVQIAAAPPTQDAMTTMAMMELRPKELDAVAASAVEVGRASMVDWMAMVEKGFTVTTADAVVGSAAAVVTTAGVVVVAIEEVVERAVLDPGVVTVRP